MDNVSGRKALVLGAGKSGISAAALLIKKGAAKVVLADEKPADKLDEAVKALEPMGVIIEAGGFKPATILDSDLIVVSPGVPLAGDWHETALRNAIEIIGEIELAYNFMNPCKIVAITGTNGKTTATTLMYEVLKAQFGEKAAVAGNIGIPYCDLAASGAQPEYIALEVSSFQLESIKKFKPYVSVVLNITDDHMDRYPSMQAYAQAKANVYMNQGPGDGVTVLNADDRFTGILSSLARNTKVMFSASRVLNDGWYSDGKAIYKSTDGHAAWIIGTEEMLLKGAHNYENVMAVFIASAALGLDMERVKETIRNFRGLPHRIEYCGELNGIKFYDDSKGTNIDAVIKAVNTFTGPLGLVLGGREKNTDFNQLLAVLPGNVKFIIALGENREKIEMIFGGRVPVIKTMSMDEVVSEALKRGGIDTLLLSPGCASFDLFKNYAHRGDEFKKAAHKAGAV